MGGMIRSQLPGESTMKGGRRMEINMSPWLAREFWTRTAKLKTPMSWLKVGDVFSRSKHEY